MANSFTALSKEILACTACSQHLPCGVRPVFQASPEARVLIAGQAPGKKVHKSGIPFDDSSGDRLRDWLGITREAFYNPKKVAIVPMGFCYPGKGKSGDLPPRQECADLWREKLLSELPNIKITLIIGKYAQDWHCDDKQKTLTERVKNWQDHFPQTIPLPHPSPRNNIWLHKNPWFETELIGPLRLAIKSALA